MTVLEEAERPTIALTKNFDFLKLNPQLDERFGPTTRGAEENYAYQDFEGVITKARKISENIVKDVAERLQFSFDEHASFNDRLRTIKHKLPQNLVDSFYDVKGKGNLSAHELNPAVATGKDALRILQDIRRQLLWYAKSTSLRNLDVLVQLQSFEVPAPKSLYQPAEKKFIYIQSVDNSDGGLDRYEGTQKIGDGTVPKDVLEADFSPNSPFLQQEARKRANQYMKTSGLPYQVGWAELAYIQESRRFFRDHEVHRVLERSGYHRPDYLEGREWFKVDVETAKKAITAVKEGRSSLDELAPSEEEKKITLRPSQQDAVLKTKKVLSKKKDMLWNAKMRFGKTLTTLQLVKEMGFQKVLLMTHRPVVKDSWFEDFQKMEMNQAGYLYGSQGKGKSIEELKESQSPFVYFASIQYLRYGNGQTNLPQFADVDWDLIVVDEAHEGTQTELSDQVMSALRKEETKVLELSGTPFNLLSKYEEDQIYTWDYTMEQEEKLRYSLEHPGEPNPYGTLPQVNMFTFQMDKQEGYTDERGSFNFREFFRVDDAGKLVHAADVSAFLDNISGRKNKNTNYPFAKEEFRNALRHTLWLLPGVREANAFENLLVGHPVFGREYTIVNAVREGDNGGEATQGDLDRVREAIGADPSKSKTITLTVRKLTTGVNVPEWTGVVFLSNTSSPTNYLQAAFRAQTPFSHEVLGQKDNCYVFDFAPDRALTVMAEAAQINSGVGKKNTQEQKDSMTKLLNFLPILGENGHDMEPFNVDRMLTQLKKVYAEKAVRSGFEDDSLYNDELLTLTADDASVFNDVKAIVGTTKAERRATVVVAENGLTDEEYDAGQEASKKKPRERTQHEKEILEKIKEAQKQRKAMISILRGVSIRIPMMIYGMPVDLNEEITIDGFIKSVDDKSWAEFMPKGFTKAMFRKITKYYDSEVFIEAGKIIRRKAKSFDQLDLVERAEKIAELFGTFKNPDKETVLTPWRVVNLQLVKTLGGLNFYDDQFEHTSSGAVYQNHWVSLGDLTQEVYQPGVRFLDINAKTGLYPLHVAMSLYYQALAQNDGGKFAPIEVYQRILREQVFAIAKTPMARTITQRTLAGYRDLETQIHYIEDFDRLLQSDLEAGLKKVKETFGPMKFDVVVGNPPYQKDAAGDSSKQDPIYHRFMELSYQLADRVALITPARFLFNAGGTPKEFNKKMLDDKHLQVVHYVQDSSKVFPSTDIKGGVAVTYRDSKKTEGPIGTFIAIPQLASIAKKLEPQLGTPLSSVVSGRGVYRLSSKALRDFPKIEDIQSKGHKHDIGTSAFKLLKGIVVHENKPNDGHEYFRLLGLNNAKERSYRWIRKDYLVAPASFNKYKVIIPKSNGSGAIGEVLSTPLVGSPLVGFTETFISIGEFESQSEADNCLKYIKTKFCRANLGILKITQDNTREKWSRVPIQDFSDDSEVPWDLNIEELDQYFYQKYGLNQEEIDFIESRVSPMS